jgi:hypothetical protein
VAPRALPPLLEEHGFGSEAGGTAVTLTLGSDEHVSLRHLVIQGPGASIGVLVSLGANSTVTIADVTIDGLGEAIGYISGTSSSSMLVDHTSITSVLGEGIDAVGRLVVQHSHIQVGNAGVTASDGARVLIRDTSISGSNNFAVWAQVDHAGNRAEIYVEDSSITDSDTAVESGCCNLANALVTVSGSTLTNNRVVFDAGTGSTVKSRSNNTVRDFTTLSSGPGTVTTFTAQ